MQAIQITAVGDKYAGKTILLYHFGMGEKPSMNITYTA